MNKEFEVHMLNAEGVKKANVIANIFDTALDNLLLLIGVSGREVAIVKTKMEEASFFSKKAMASRPENQLQKIGESIKLSTGE